LNRRGGLSIGFVDESQSEPSDNGPGTFSMMVATVTKSGEVEPMKGLEDLNPGGSGTMYDAASR
jgi:hypothetical protein